MSTYRLGSQHPVRLWSLVMGAALCVLLLPGIVAMGVQQTVKPRPELVSLGGENTSWQISLDYPCTQESAALLGGKSWRCNDVSLSSNVVNWPEDEAAADNALRRLIRAAGMFQPADSAQLERVGDAYIMSSSEDTALAWLVPGTEENKGQAIAVVILNDISDAATHIAWFRCVGDQPFPPAMEAAVSQDIEARVGYLSELSKQSRIPQAGMQI